MAAYQYKAADETLHLDAKPKDCDIKFLMKAPDTLEFMLIGIVRLGGRTNPIKKF